MATKRKASTKKGLESKIAELEAKLSKLSSQLESKPAPKPAETKPAPPPKPQEAPKPAAETKPAPPPKPQEAPKPAETKPAPPVTIQEALENAYRTAPMSSFHDYRAKVTGYSPAPNRYFVRLTAPVGKVPTSNWNDQKAKVTGYTQPSNQYFATRARLAYHPPDKTFGGFSGTNMSVEGVQIKAETQHTPPPPQELPKAAKGKLPKVTQAAQHSEGKSKQQLLEEYEDGYLQRIEQQKIADQKAYEEAVAAETKPSSTSGTLPKGFESKSEQAAAESTKTSKGTLPKGF